VTGTQLSFAVVRQGEGRPELSAKLGLSGLESHLWEAANILRGPVDAADFKTYIFPLLFFKRVCDVYDEEVEAALAESGGDREYALFPENHSFLAPWGCHWRDVRAVSVYIGRHLQHAMREVKQALRRTLLKYKLHQQHDLFDRACTYIE
jgi:type I restriction enzyme M protein